MAGAGTTSTAPKAPHLQGARGARRAVAGPDSRRFRRRRFRITTRSSPGSTRSITASSPTPWWIRSHRPERFTMSADDGERCAVVGRRAALGHRASARAGARRRCSGRDPRSRLAASGPPTGSRSTTTSRTRDRVQQVLDLACAAGGRAARRSSRCTSATWTPPATRTGRTRGRRSPPPKGSMRSSGALVAGIEALGTARADDDRRDCRSRHVAAGRRPQDLHRRLPRSGDRGRHRLVAGAADSGRGPDRWTISIARCAANIRRSRSTGRKSFPRALHYGTIRASRRSSAWPQTAGRSRRTRDSSAGRRPASVRRRSRLRPRVNSLHARAVRGRGSDDSARALTVAAFREHPRLRVDVPGARAEAREERRRSRLRPHGFWH